jgi:hypothetical protein
MSELINVILVLNKKLKIDDRRKSIQAIVSASNDWFDIPDSITLFDWGLGIEKHESWHDDNLLKCPLSETQLLILKNSKDNLIIKSIIIDYQFDKTIFNISIPYNNFKKITRNDFEYWIFNIFKYMDLFSIILIEVSSEGELNINKRNDLDIVLDSMNNLRGNFYVMISNNFDIDINYKFKIFKKNEIATLIVKDDIFDILNFKK